MKKFSYTILTSFLAKGDKSRFEIDRKTQEAYISSFGHPKNDYDRSYKQYLCQNLFRGRCKIILYNFISLLSILPYMIISFINGFVPRRKKEHVEAIEQRNSYWGVVPIEVSSQYKMIQDVWNKGLILLPKDIKTIIPLLSYIIHSPYFVLKNLYKIGLYSYMIKVYSPNVIIVYNEYSFTSSILTLFCETNNVKHINIMHGEKLYHIRDSFFRFSKMYVWDKYYIDLFLKLRAFPKQFIVSSPPSMNIHKSNGYDAEQNDYTYYLESYTTLQLKNIIDTLSILKQRGKKVVYRPHPRYSNIPLLMTFVDKEDIEFPTDVDIFASLKNTKCAIGLFTSVLNQAFHSNINVVIDDVNFPEKYCKLKSLDYILILQKDICTLSTLLQNN